LRTADASAKMLQFQRGIRLTFLLVESPSFVLHTTPNRSLGVVARRRVLLLLALTTLGIATAAAAIGAWPVMPFAGAEIALLALAFHVLATHDADFERLEIGAAEVRLEAREARSFTRFVARPPWASVVVARRGRRCTLRLAYGARAVAMGRMLSDEGRRRLAESLRGRIPLRESKEI